MEREDARTVSTDNLGWMEHLYNSTGPAFRTPGVRKEGGNGRIPCVRTLAWFPSIVG